MAVSVEQVRAHCFSLPAAEERETWGEPTFRIRDKIFALLRCRDGQHSVWCKAAPGMQQALIAANPACYFYPPYVGHKGWIGIRLDSDLDWDEAADLISASYRLIAPKRMRAH